MMRAEYELDMLEQISQVLGDGLELKQVFEQAMKVLVERIGVDNGALLLWDDAFGELKIICAIGLSSEQVQRGRYACGEGVTGQVFATGTPAIIPDVAKHPDFLNRTGRHQLEGEKDSTTTSATPPTCFIGVPIKDGERYVGVLSIDKPYVDEVTLAAEARLLSIIAGSFAQTIRIHHLVQCEKDQWLEENQRLRANLGSKYKFDNIIGSSPAMLDVLATVSQVASSRASILLLGETGVGKELIAKALHYNSSRRDKPLIRVNCSALSPQLLESELFGHLKGSFTGAMRDKIGRFEAADGGTLFLDEIGTLDMPLQVKLLRVLQERELERVGDHRSVKVDVRVIAATNIDLEENITRGKFREDLYYRLNVVTINVPALRSRREDITQLIDFFLDRYNKENNRNLHKISRDLINVLLRYPWPGNVRELENAIERAVVLSTSEQFTDELLPLQIRMFSQQVRSSGRDESIEAQVTKLAENAVKEYQVCEGQIYELVIKEMDRQLIAEALRYTNGVKTKAADFLGINRNTLNKKVKELDIPIGDV